MTQRRARARTTDWGHGFRLVDRVIHAEAALTGETYHQVFKRTLGWQSWVGSGNIGAMRDRVAMVVRRIRAAQRSA